jgi:hypothetical protein
MQCALLVAPIATQTHRITDVVFRKLASIEATFYRLTTRDDIVE